MVSHLEKKQLVTFIVHFGLCLQENYTCSKWRWTEFESGGGTLPV